MTLCLCRSGKIWIGASNEPLMASLAGKTKDGESVGADVAIRVDWKQVGAVMEKLVARGGELELFPGRNKADLDMDVVPILKALGRLGTLRIDAKNQGPVLEFSGFLANAPSKREETGK
jgi:hypothetical protein